MNDNILVADIEGYAAIFGERDLNGDIIAPGAFRATLARRKSIKMLYQHAAEAPIGRWTAFHEDGRGLYAVGEILIGSRQARDVHALLAGAALSGLSIGYKTVKADKTSNGRRILEADLWEVSIVTFPMAPRAQVTFVGDPRPNTSPPNPHRAPTPKRGLRVMARKRWPVRSRGLAGGRLFPPSSTRQAPANSPTPFAARRVLYQYKE